jgi:hypothetical protein
MDLTSAKTGNLIENASTAGFGFLGFVNAATSKFAGNYASNNASYSVFSKQRIEDALSCIVGKGNVAKLDSSYTQSYAPTAPSIHPMSALNMTTYYGLGTVIADWALREVAPAKYYKSVPILPDVVKGAGVGLLIGGIIGGIFDPNPSGYTMISPSPLTGQNETGGIATGNVPYARGGSTMSVYKGSILA